MGGKQCRSIPLKCNCPPCCECGGKEVRNWKHKPCLIQCMINENGEIFCQDYQSRHNCSSYFLQHAQFKCTESKSWEQFKSASQFMMALAQGVQSAEYGLTDNELVQFVTRLNQQVMRRWRN